MTTVTEGRNLCWVMNRWCRSEDDSGSLLDWESWKWIKKMKSSPKTSLIIYSCSYSHITLQPKTGCPLKLSMGWAWSVPGWETSWENKVSAGRGVSEASRGCSPCGLCGSYRPSIGMRTLYCQQAPSFGWDVKLRSWLSVVIKNPMALLVKSRGVTPVWSWCKKLEFIKTKFRSLILIGWAKFEAVINYSTKHTPLFTFVCCSPTTTISEELHCLVEE